MKKQIIIIFICSILSVFSSSIYGQILITGYTNYAIGISTNTNKLISVELKTFTNRSFDNLLFEFDGFYNFKTRKYHQFSIGVGVKVLPFEDYFFDALTIPLTLNIYPLQEFRKISLVLEVAPEYYISGDGDDFNLRSLFGIRYKF